MSAKADALERLSRFTRREQERYRVILADPPWRYGNWTDAKNGAAVSAMDTMPSDDIAALNVGENFADPAGCFLFLWGTWPKLPQAIQVVEAWGFAYITAIPWVKTCPSTESIAASMGFWSLGASEILIIARRGKAKRRGVKLPPVRGLLEGDDRRSPIFYAPRKGRHSTKPEELRCWIERVADGPYLELFARRQYPGWRCVGLDLGERITPSGIERICDGK